MISVFWKDGRRTNANPITPEDRAVYAELRIIDAQSNFTGNEMQLIEERLRLVYRRAVKDQNGDPFADQPTPERPTSEYLRMLEQAERRRGQIK